MSIYEKLFLNQDNFFSSLNFCRKKAKDVYYSYIW